MSASKHGTTRRSFASRIACLNASMCPRRPSRARSASRSAGSPRGPSTKIDGPPHLSAARPRSASSNRAGPTSAHPAEPTRRLDVGSDTEPYPEEPNRLSCEVAVSRGCSFREVARFARTTLCPIERPARPCCASPCYRRTGASLVATPPAWPGTVGSRRARVVRTPVFPRTGGCRRSG